MHPNHAPWVRDNLARKFMAVRVWMSTLSDPPETHALGVLSNAEIMSRILDQIMVELGYVPKNAKQGDNGLAVPGELDNCRRVQAMRKRLKGPRGERAETEETETV